MTRGKRKEEGVEIDGRILLRTLLLALIVLLLVYLLWGYGSRAVERVDARVQELRRGSAALLEAEPAGPWQAAPDVIGTLYLAHCHGYMAWPFRVEPAGKKELAAVAENPAEPAIPDLLAASKPFYIPRQGTVTADVNAWTEAHREPDCKESPWAKTALKRLPTPDPDVAQRLKRADAATAQQLLADLHPFRVFAAARPVLRDNKPFWELRFYATGR